MVHILVNDKSKEGKALLEHLKQLSYVEIVDGDNYDNEFVEKILKRTKNAKKNPDKLHRLNPKDIWGSIL